MDYLHNPMKELHHPHFTDEESEVKYPSQDHTLGNHGSRIAVRAV